MMIIKIINARTGRLLFETGYICQPIKFLAIDNKSFTMEYRLNVTDSRSFQSFEFIDLSLNDLSEILDSLHRTIIKIPLEVKNGR